MLVGGTIGACNVFPKQIIIVNKERVRHLYRLWVYYVAGVVVTLPVEAVPHVSNHAYILKA